MSPEVAESRQGAASWTCTTDRMGGGDVPFTTVAGLPTFPIRTGRSITHQAQSRVCHPAAHFGVLPGLNRHPRPLRRTYAMTFPLDAHTTPTPVRHSAVGRTQNEAPFTTVSELVDDSPTSIALGRTILLDQFQLCSPDSPRLHAQGPSDKIDGGGPALPYQSMPGSPDPILAGLSFIPTIESESPGSKMYSFSAGTITEPCSPQAAAMHPDYLPTTPRLTSNKVQTEQVEGSSLVGNLLAEPYQPSRSEADYDIGYRENHNSNTEYHLEVVEDLQENMAWHDMPTWNEDIHSAPPSPGLQVAPGLVPGGPVDLLIDGQVYHEMTVRTLRACKFQKFNPLRPTKSALDIVISFGQWFGKGITKSELRQILRLCHACGNFMYVERRGTHQCEAAAIQVQAQDFDFVSSLLSFNFSSGLDYEDLRHLIMTCGGCSRICLRAAIMYHECPPKSRRQ
ncbi:hypothetical protein DFP72DRAFT_857039 [Ephemerocybe angulata]|uniref:Uncharacterized protein n=1 Tax=Ephemerocybe angulata TaxID=980116 RepID=A0A8H6HEW2_9AGAR|nr:hypothetical protein DFP72DRAFT_857039 [Tulosesus angulatus]